MKSMAPKGNFTSEKCQHIARNHDKRNNVFGHATDL